MSAIEIIALIIAIAFFILVIYLILLIQSLFSTLKKVDNTLDAITSEIENLEDEPRILLENINNIAEDIFYKLDSLNPLFQIVEDIGEGVEYKTSLFKDRLIGRPKKKEFEEERIKQTGQDIINFVVSGVNLFKKLRRDNNEEF